MPDRHDGGAGGTPDAAAATASAGGDGTVELRPARGIAVAWSLAGIVLAAAAGWLTLDSRGHPLAWAGLAVAVTVTSYFVLQAAVPRWFVVRIDGRRLTARTLWFRVSVPWSRVHLARVERSAGDPILVIEAWEGQDREPGSARAVGILLPVGADIPALHEALAVNLSSPSRSDQ